MPPTRHRDDDLETLTPLERAEATREAEETENVKLEVQKMLASYVGRRINQNSPIVYHDEPKNKFSLPMNSTPEKAVKVLQSEIQAQKTMTVTVRQLNCRIEDGLVAMNRVLERVFGSTGRGITHFSFFGEEPPQKLNVTVGLNPDGSPITLSVPASEIEFAWLDATIDVDTWQSRDDPHLLQLNVKHPVKNQIAVDGLLQMIEDEVTKHSIYKGHILQYQGEPNGYSYSLKYVHRKADLTIVYSKEVQDAIQDDVWGKMQYDLMLREAGEDTHFKVLFWGPLGTGKSEACITSALIAQECGRTVIEYKPTSADSIDELIRVISVAERYGPTVIYIEDFDRFFSPDMSAKSLSTLTNLFDGSDKNNNVSIMMTTNHIRNIRPEMTRAGRLTAQIEVGPLDQEGMQRLIVTSLGDQLEQHIDWDAIWRQIHDFSPAFIKATAKKVKGVSITRNGRPGLPIGTEDIIRAAHSQRAQVNLHAEMTKAQEDELAPAAALDASLAEVVRRQLESMLIEFPGSRLGTGKVRVTNGK